MAKVIGLGGIFFKSQDPERLRAWYRKWLQVPAVGADGASFQPVGQPKGAFSVWSPFPANTRYFGTGDQPYMVNLMVDDVDGALAQVQEGGAELVGEIEQEDFGRFGWFIDPDGNKVELWQPPD